MSNQPISAVVGIEFVVGSGTFVDVSARVASILINRPRTPPGGDTTATQLGLTLYNHPATAAELVAWGAPAGAVGYCPFTPDSAPGAFYPQIERDRRIKVTYTWNAGANTSVRFFGWIDLWEPNAGDSPPGSAMVEVSASCVLSRYERRPVLSYYGENVTAIDHIDYWPFDDGPDAINLRVKNNPENDAALDGQLIFPKAANTGGAVLSSPDGGQLADGQIAFTRGDPSGPSPVVLLTTRTTPVLSIECQVKLSVDPAGLTDDIMAGYDASGARLWRFTASVVGGIIFYRIYDNLDVVQSEYNSTTGRDDAWRWFVLLLNNSTTSNLFTRKKPNLVELRGGFGTFADDPRNTKYIVVGGQMPPFRSGKQTNTIQGSISSVAVQYTSYSGAFDEMAIPTVLRQAYRVTDTLTSVSLPYDTLVGGAVAPVSVDTTGIMTTTNINTLLEWWNQHTRTVGGLLITRPDGRRQYFTSNDTRSGTVALTLNAEQDLHAPAGGWSGIKVERPTRITVDGPIGSTTVIDTASETALGFSLESPTMDTSAGNVSVSRSVAGRQLTMGLARLNSFGVDWTTTATDQNTAAMALLPGDRVRITNLPSSYMGVTQVDVYASGWTEQYDPSGAAVYFTFDTDMADNPPEAVWDSATTARWGMSGSTVTGGTCLGGTGTGTVIITAPTDVLTTTGGEYTMDLNWNGERITVSGVGGGVSPQTATVTARGVAPSVARVHASGETIDVWQAFTWSP